MADVTELEAVGEAADHAAALASGRRAASAEVGAAASIAPATATAFDQLAVGWLAVRLAE